MKLILGSVIVLIMGVCFFRIPYHAVLLGRPVYFGNMYGLVSIAQLYYLYMLLMFGLEEKTTI